MRSERWTEIEEIQREFPTIEQGAGGPIIYPGYYVDDSEAHIGVFGNTGLGKSACVATPTSYNVCDKREVLIAVDPKGDLKRATESIRKLNSYRTITIDLRHPFHSTHWFNLLKSPMKHFFSGEPDLIDIASSEIDEQAHGLTPVSGKEDPFWPHSAADLLMGVIHALLLVAPEDEVNYASVARIIQESENKVGTRGTMIAEFAKTLPEDSIARRHLDGYVSAPNETRGSIHASAAQAISIFSRSQGLVNLLSRDNIDVDSLDVDKPLAIFIILPDETSTYDNIAGLMVSQLTQHFIRLAHDKYGGRLPRRVNIILEELGNIGRAIPNLPHLMSASRSRNIRLMLVLQDGKGQLEDIYGSAKASTINSCIGINYVFSSNNFNALEEWSKRCGMREVSVGREQTIEPLITASQLASMPVGTALVMIKNQYKYIVKLPFFSEMFEMGSDDDSRTDINNDEDDFNAPIFSISKYLNDLKAKKIGEESPKPDLHVKLSPWRNTDDEIKVLSDSIPFMEDDDSRPGVIRKNEINVDDLIKKIDAKIAELEKEEEEERRKKEEENQ